MVWCCVLIWGWKCRVNWFFDRVLCRLVFREMCCWMVLWVVGLQKCMVLWFVCLVLYIVMFVCLRILFIGVLFIGSMQMLMLVEQCYLKLLRVQGCDKVLCIFFVIVCMFLMVLNFLGWRLDRMMMNLLLFWWVMVLWICMQLCSCCVILINKVFLMLWLCVLLSFLKLFKLMNSMVVIFLWWLFEVCRCLSCL